MHRLLHAPSVQLRRPIASGGYALLYGACALLLLTASPAVLAETTLRVVGHWSGWQLQEFTRNAEAYMALHPDITIEFIFSPMDRYEGVGKVLVMMGGATTPDIIHSYLALTPELLAAGLLSPMPSELERAARAFYFAPLLSGLTFAGRLYGFPTENQTYVLLYNSAMFAEAGVAGPPRRWDELRAAARRLTRQAPDGRPERYGFTMDRPSAFIQFTHDFLTFLWSNGGTYLDAAGRSGLADPPAAATVRFLQDLAASGLMRLGGGMGDGLSAMAIAPPWWRQGLMAAAAADYQNLRTTLMPAGEGQPTAYQYGWGLFVTAASPHAREAWEFLRWLAMSPGPRSATRMGEHMVQLGSLPTNPWDIDRIDVFREDPFYTGFIESLRVARAEPALPQMSLRHEAIAQILGPAIEGRVPIGTAIAQAAERVETILAEAAQNSP